MPSGPPYLPHAALVGGIPTVSLDVPICVVFILLYAVGAAGNLIIFRRNWSRGHRFIISAFLAMFCVSRIVTNIMRIVWATRQRNASIAIAAQILVSAGILIVYLVNLVFASRLLEASRPSISKNLAYRLARIGLCVLLFILLATVITVSVQSFYTLNPHTLQIDRHVQLAAITILINIAFLPFPLMLVAAVLARRKPPKEFGSGSWRSKFIVLLIGTLLANLIAGFKCGTAWERPRPSTDPAWFSAKWAFYYFGFAQEIIFVYTYLVFRVDRRFHVIGEKEVRNESREQSVENSEKPSGEALWGGPVSPLPDIRDSSSRLRYSTLSDRDSGPKEDCCRHCRLRRNSYPWNGKNYLANETTGTLTRNADDDLLRVIHFLCSTDSPKGQNDADPAS
jgi:hypothetical protein